MCSYPTQHSPHQPCLVEAFWRDLVFLPLYSRPKLPTLGRFFTLLASGVTPDPRISILASTPDPRAWGREVHRAGGFSFIRDKRRHFSLKLFRLESKCTTIHPGL